MSIRVLRIIARLNVGGPAIHASLLARGLDSSRYDTRLVAGPVEPGEASHLDLHGGEIPGHIELPALGREVSPWRDRAAFSGIVRIVRDFKPHIVHTHTAKAGMVGRFAARYCGVPVIVHTFHGHVLHGYFSRSKESMFVMAERLAARVTTRIVAVSETVRDDLLTRGVGRPDQYEVIHLGLDLSRFAVAERRRGELRAELGVGPSTPLVGIVARLVPIKAHEVFLDAAAILLRTFPEALFIVVGDGERRSALEAQARDRKILRNVRFLGWRSDLDRLYADFDVVMLTSRNEGSPVALIEAMASARPVVATRAGGVAELVGTDGLLAAVDDRAALAAHVARLLRDESLAATLGARARSRVLPAFGADRLVRDVDQLYQRCLQEV